MVVSCFFLLGGLGVLAVGKQMTIGFIEVNHVNVTVPAAQEDAAKHFYGVVLGLRQIPKPEGTRQNMGAWYDLGGIQLHLSTEDGASNEVSDRHVCYQVSDIAVADLEFRNAGVEIIRDPRPIQGQSRFFVRDPGGNLLEITQKT
jgi:catechol 2,3-dioxygenase-like lactoylglutathione lyase family enzyme